MTTVWTRNAIASAIVSYLVNGLKGVSEQSYIIPQLEAEIDTVRASILQQLPPDTRVSESQLTQKIPCLTMDCRDIAQCCDTNRFKTEPVMHTEIPKLASLRIEDPIVYLGTIDYARPFKVYTTPNRARSHKGSFIAKNLPYAWVDMSVNNNGKHDVWFWNIKLAKTATIQAVFENPEDVYEYTCCQGDRDLLGYPAPNWMIEQIKDTLVNKYMNAYKRSIPNQIVTPDNNTYTS
jgi:hypothetical protein